MRIYERMCAFIRRVSGVPPAQAPESVLLVDVAVGAPSAGLTRIASDVEGLSGEVAHVAVALGVSYSARWEDADSKLNVNAASEDELRDLFLAAGVGFLEADIAAQSVMDWRDPDELHRGRGGERDDWYRQLRVPVYPRNGPFESIAELRNVRGMDLVFPCVVPLLTTLGRGRVNVNPAPREVLRAIPGLDNESGRILLAYRHRNRPLRDAFKFESLLSPRSREHLQRHSGAFRERAEFDSDMLVVRSSGSVEGLPFRRTV